jgi:hypothetical protein
MTDSEITTTILRQIRDEIITTRTELKSEIGDLRSELKAEIGRTNERLDVTNERLSVVEHVVRDVAEQMGTLTRYVKHAHGSAIDDLRKRVTRLEKKVG